MELKVVCNCGQKYKFDVEPAGGRMPFPVNCPVCGADGTSLANTLLAQNVPKPANPIALPVQAPLPLISLAPVPAKAADPIDPPVQAPVAAPLPVITLAPIPVKPPVPVTIPVQVPVAASVPVISPAPVPAKPMAPVTIPVQVSVTAPSPIIAPTPIPAKPADPIVVPVQAPVAAPSPVISPAPVPAKPAASSIISAQAPIVASAPAVSPSPIPARSVAPVALVTSANTGSTVPVLPSAAIAATMAAAGAPHMNPQPALARVLKRAKTDGEFSLGKGLVGALLGAAVGVGIMYAFFVLAQARFPLMGTAIGALSGLGARILYKGTDSTLGAWTLAVSLACTTGALIFMYHNFEGSFLITMLASAGVAYSIAGRRRVAFRV